MYSFLFSKINDVSDSNLKICRQYLKNDKIAVFPWIFASESNLDDVRNDFFCAGGKHFEKYFSLLGLLGFDRENIKIVNPYLVTKDEVKDILDKNNYVFIPGGNPEMFMTLAIRLGVLEFFTNYNGNMIGESAGSDLQFELYQIPKVNNFYDGSSYYNGFGLIKGNYIVDVHSQKNESYLKELTRLAQMKNLKILTVDNNSCVIVNRQNNDIIKIGNVDEIN